MYKSKLQILCQGNSWGLPEYSTTKCGHDHNPSFTAAVAVNGVRFNTTDESRNSKEAQDKAAKIAFEHLSSANPYSTFPQPSLVAALSSPAAPASSDMSHLHKHRLQNYAQKRNLPMPEYSTEHEGPPHDDSGLYKNLLRNLAEKEGLDVIYETNVSGPPHMPTFVSTVVIKGQPFEGQPTKSKKQAETNAAKVAYTGLQERRASVMPMDLSSGCQIKEALEVSSSILLSVIAGDLQQCRGPKANLITRKEQSKEDAGDVFPGDLQQTAEPTATLVIWEEQDKDYIAGHEDNWSSNLTTSNAKANNRHAAPPPPGADINLKRNRCSTPADIIHASLQDPSPSTFSSPEDGFSLPLVHSQSSKNSTLDSHNEIPIGAANGKNTLPREKILIHPRKPNMTFPEGANVLPFGDDKWVAMKMNPGQQ